MAEVCFPVETLQRLSELEDALRKQEEDTVKAAMFGKALLEENSDLQHRIDDLINQHGTDTEEKQQLISSLQARCEIYTRTEAWYQEEINSLRSQLQSVKQSVSNQLEEQKKSEINSYRKQVDSLQLDLQHSRTVEQELHQRVKELELLLQSHLDRTQVHSVSLSFDVEDTAALQVELHALRMDVTELRASNIDLTGQVKQLQQEREILKSRLAACNREVEELQCQISCYVNYLEEARQEASRMRGQVEEAALEGQHHSSKGNSLFSELEDRRLEVERKMATLRVQNQQLKEKYEAEKQQNQKYRRQTAMALCMASQKQDDPHIQRLHSQLKEAHAEIQTLTKQLQNIETDKSAFMDMQTFSSLLNEVEDKNYVEFLLTVIRTEKENTAKANSELQTKSLQYLDMSNQNAELTQQIKRLEAEQGKLHAALLAMKLQKEELLLKYEPEQIKGSKLQRKVVEKIDMGGTQSQVTENVLSTFGKGKFCDIFRSTSSVSSSSRANNVLKPFNACGRMSDICKPAGSTEKVGIEVVPNMLPSLKHIKPKDSVPEEDTFLDNKENIRSMEWTALYGRKVSMADDVRVIESDGEERTRPLSNLDEKSAKPVASEKKPPGSVISVKRVSASEAPELQCKTQ